VELLELALRGVRRRQLHRRDPFGQQLRVEHLAVAGRVAGRVGVQLLGALVLDAGPGSDDHQFLGGLVDLLQQRRAGAAAADQLQRLLHRLHEDTVGRLGGHNRALGGEGLVGNPERYRGPAMRQGSVGRRRRARSHGCTPALWRNHTRRRRR